MEGTSETSLFELLCDQFIVHFEPQVEVGVDFIGLGL